MGRTRDQGHDQVAHEYAPDPPWQRLQPKADLSDSHLSESDIRGSRFHWTHLDRTYLDNVLFDNETSFLGVDLNAVNFTLATLLHDLALSQQRIQQLETHYPLFAFFLRVTCDYGRSFWRYAIWVFGLVVVYTIIYASVPTLLSDPPTPRSVRPAWTAA